jgi:lysophospholipase L1-like esterase
MRIVPFLPALPALFAGLSAAPALAGDYAYGPYNEGRLDPQRTGWPLTDGERKFVLRPEHERRPGSEAGKHLPELWPVTPSAGFWGGTSWLEAHTAAAKLARDAKGPADILLVGDSLTQAWGGGWDGKPFLSAWTKRFGGYKTVNIGIGGDKTQNVLWRLDHGAVDGLRPRAIVLLIGTNNMYQAPETGAEAAAAGVKACVDNLRGRFAEAPVVVVKVIPAGKPGDPFRENVRKTNAALDRLNLAADPKVVVLDLTADLTEADGALKAGHFGNDGIHLTPERGYEVFAERLRPLVEKALGGGK